MERLVLIDGSNLVYRAFFGLPQSLRSSSGMVTNAVFGFATMFRKLFAGKMPAYGAVIFDAPGGSFRDEAYADYKGTREEMPKDLRAQLPKVFELCEVSGFRMLRIAGVEADDVIGTLAKQGLDAGFEVQIISSDKDFAQLIEERLRLVDTLRDVSFDADLAYKKWGVKPSQMIDYLALVGDSIDNVPGVAGFGAKSAVELLEKFGTLEAIYAELERPGSDAKDAPIKARQRKALLEGKESALLSKDLVTIRTTLDVGVTLEELKLPPPDQEKLNRFYVGMEFYSLIDEQARQELASGEVEVEVTRVVEDEELEALLADLGREQPVALVGLCDFDAPVVSPLVAIALATSPTQAWVLPLKAPHSLSLSAHGRQALKAWLEDGARQKVCHDMKELYRALRREDEPITLAGTTFDTRLASFLIDPTKIIPHRLDQLTKEFLQRTLTLPKAVVGTGQKLKAYSDIEAETLDAYAGELASTICELYPIVSKRLDEANMREQHDAHDLPLSYVLAEMELAGILVDRQDLLDLSAEFHAKLDSLEQEIWKLAGKEFNIGSPKQLAEVLFEDLMLPVIKRNKTGYSTDAEVLEALRLKHPIIEFLLEHRKLAKLLNTYTDVLPQEISPKTGRIHATFQQTTAQTGRIITTDPDLQRTPVHTPEGKRIRHAFIAPEGMALVVADWSQIELRLLAHVTKDARLVEAFQTNADVHRQTASQIFKVALNEVTSEQRGIGKTINFATIYGQGASSLAQMLGISNKDAKSYIDSYFAYYEGVQAWLKQTTEQALRDGYVETLNGRRRYIPELSSKSPMERQAGIRIACNTPIQGSAADLCKAVMLEVPKAFKAANLSGRMLLQIHDELVFEVPLAEVEQTSQLVKHLMETHVTLDVPLIADVGAGRTWADAKG